MVQTLEDNVEIHTLVLFALEVEVVRKFVEVVRLGKFLTEIVPKTVRSDRLVKIHPILCAVDRVVWVLFLLAQFSLD